MYVSTISVDRFGRRSNLRIEGLSDGLTVFFGQQGSGKTTLADFLRAMWTGFDSSLREKYLPPDSRGFGGVVTVQTPHGRQTISRYDDGGHEGRLSVEREDGAIIGRRDVQDLIGNVSASLVDLAYIIDFHRRPQLSELLQLAVERGFPLRQRPTSPERVPIVERMIAENRDRLARLASSLEPADVLRRRRRDLLHQFDSLTATVRDETEERQKQLKQLEQEIEAAERRVAELRHELQLSTATRFVDPRNVSGQVKLLDRKIARWKRTLRDVIRRKRRAAESCDHDQANSVAEAAKRARPRLRLSAIEAKIRELEQALPQSPHQNQCSCHELRTTISAALGGMRNELYLLCDDLSLWQSNHRYRQVSGERSQLARCEVELRNAVYLLNKRRQTLIQQLTSAASTPASDRQLNAGHNVEQLSPIVPSSLPTSGAEQLRQLFYKKDAEYCQCADHPDPKHTTHSELPPERLPMTVATSSDPNVEESRRLKQTELKHISEQIADKRGQLQKLKSSIADRSRQIDAVRAALDSVKEQLRNHEQRLAMIAEIARLEAECRKLREDERVPALVHEASRHLCRLTSGEWTAVHISSPNEVWIETSRGGRLSFNEMEPGNRDQVYLAICLAVVAACERDGIHLPLVLNGPFSHFPAKHIHGSIDLLRDFAHGRQVLWLTSDESVVREARALTVPVRMIDGAKQPTPQPHHVADVPSHEDASEHSLSERDPIERAPSVNAVNACRLRAVGVERVGDLLRTSAITIAAKLQHSELSAEVIFDWQAQARLMCQIHTLRAYDARILVACGITTAAELHEMTSTALRARVKILSATPDGQATILSGTEEERARLIDWVRPGPKSRRARGAAAKPSKPLATKSVRSKSARNAKSPHAA